jgi:hypothetical protein
MLLIKEYSNEVNHRILRHGEDVFHKALEAVLKGEREFHVLGENGLRYNLKYIENQSWAEAGSAYPDSPLFHKDPLYPPYYFYDEYDRERLCFDILEGFEGVWFEEVNEYTVVLAGVLLRYTSLSVSCHDSRISLFYEENERLKITEEIPPASDHRTLRVIKDFYPSAFICDFYTMDMVVLFHHIFLYQWLTSLPMDRMKYAEIVVARSEGIGSVLTIVARAKHFFKRFNLTVTIRPGSSRYADSIITKYFNMQMTPPDADESNTVYITNYYGILFTKMLRDSSGNDFDISVLNPDFVAEMKEYGDAMFGDRRMLGILLRGSDYIASGMSGASAPVTVDSALPKIREWMEDGYDGIFLATEDSDILRQMVRAFPGKVRAVAQERYGLNDFKEAGVTTISELDSIRHSGEDYDRFMKIPWRIIFTHCIFCHAVNHSCIPGSAADPP